MARRKPKYQQEAQAAAKATEAEKPLARRIVADISQQAPHTSFSGVPLYYEDKTFLCVDCGTEEVWTAEDQQWWYEVAKGYVFSKAIRCRACRAALRSAHAGNPRRSHQNRRSRQSDKE